MACTSKANDKGGVFGLSVGGGNKEKDIRAKLVVGAKEANVVASKYLELSVKNILRKYFKVIVIPNIKSPKIIPHTEAFQVVVWHRLIWCPTSASQVSN